MVSSTFSPGGAPLAVPHLFSNAMPGTLEPLAIVGGARFELVPAMVEPS